MKSLKCKLGIHDYPLMIDRRTYRTKGSGYADGMQIQLRCRRCHYLSDSYIVPIKEGQDFDIIVQ